MTPDESLKPSDATVVLSAKEIQALRSALGKPSDGPVNKDEVTQALLVDDAHVVLPKGTRLAEFEITGVIGQGGFGIVYEARDSSLEREVAIKEYLPSSLAIRDSNGYVTSRSPQHQESFDAGLKSFVNEARLLAQFDHPSLLKVYRFWDERGTTYMVMPLYKGLTLKQVLARKVVEVDEAWLTGVLDGVTQALALIHSADCFHRDIAPDNIMLVGQDHHPVVLDFGAARRVISGMTQALTVILKPGYAPVEQYADSPDFKQGPWTDIYALGAVMYGAIAKKPPPPSVTRLLSDSYKRLVDDTELRAKFSERFLSAIDAALAVRPEDRPQSMAQFRSLLGLSTASHFSSPVTGQTILLQPSAAITAQPAADAASGVAKYIPLIVGGLAAGLLAVVAYALWFKPSKSDVQLGQAAPSTVVAPIAAIAAPSIAAPVQTALTLFEGIQSAASSELKISATARNAVVKISAKDRLEFAVQSASEGYVFVYLLSSGGELLQLFPNQLDKRNRIKAGETLKLPRASWPMEAGGPVGTNRFVAVVSSVERDFSDSGLVSDGVFGRYEVAGSQPSKIIGKPKCAADVPCDAKFGAASFSISEE
jgi:serine/threonine protein kinase